MYLHVQACRHRDTTCKGISLLFTNSYLMALDSSSSPEEHSRPVEQMRDLAVFWVNAQPVLTAYIRANVTDVHHVEDILQEVARVCAEKFSEYDRERSFLSWVMGIARNRVLKYYRSCARDRMVLSEAALERFEVSLERLEPEAEDRREALRHCMEKVTGRRREVLQLRYRDNIRVMEIAEQFQMSTSSVSVMLHRIRTDLLDCIRRRLHLQGNM